MTDLAELLANPARAAEVPLANVPELLGRIELVKARLLERGMVAPTPAEPGGSERLLDVREAAARCGMSADWLYRHKDTLPFTRRLGRAVRFSETGLVRWMATRAR